MKLKIGENIAEVCASKGRVMFMMQAGVVASVAFSMTVAETSALALALDEAHMDLERATLKRLLTAPTKGSGPTKARAALPIVRGGKMDVVRGGVMATRLAHNQKTTGSSPVCATKTKKEKKR